MSTESDHLLQMGPIGPARLTGQRLQAAIFVTIQDFVAGFPGRCRTPGTARPSSPSSLPQKPDCVTHVSGMNCHPSLRKGSTARLGRSPDDILLIWLTQFTLCGRMGYRHHGVRPVRRATKSARSFELPLIPWMPIPLRSTGSCARLRQTKLRRSRRSFSTNSDFAGSHHR